MHIFRHASREDGPIIRNPAADLGGILPSAEPKHHAAITDPKAVGALMRAIRGYSGEPVTATALQLAPLVFVRPGELRAAEWSEFDLDGATWRIPGVRMKMKNGHVVPLSEQAVAILRELHKLTGTAKLVFPSIRSRARPMSENTVNAALRRLGYTTEEMTGHGFRATASTILNEEGWHHDAIERQLAHVERNEVRAAYNRAEHLPERKRMMQAWADLLDGLAAGASPAMEYDGLHNAISAALATSLAPYVAQLEARLAAVEDRVAANVPRRSITEREEAAQDSHGSLGRQMPLLWGGPRPGRSRARVGGRVGPLFQP